MTTAIRYNKNDNRHSVQQQQQQKSWRSFVRGYEGLYLPKSQTNLVIVLSMHYLYYIEILYT